MAETTMQWIGLERKVAIVTGGASGIGKEICRTFAGQGTRVAIADIDSARAKSTARSLQVGGAEAIPVVVDVGDEEQVRAGIRATVERFGTVDILVNCAGWNMFAAPTKINSELWEKVVRVNLSGPWYFCRAVMPEMTRKCQGRIVNISSAAGVRAIPKAAPYSSAKHGVIGLTRALAIDLAPYNINVNCICPSTIMTPLTHQATSPIFTEKMKESIPLGRLGESSDVAQAVMFLCSSVSNWITGVVLPVDGGLTCCIRSRHFE